MLTDPVSKGTRRSACETVEQLFVAAKRNWILTQDNLSAINGKMSDALCQLSTGGAYGKRAHYTNDEEHLIELRRPVILNGIPDLASRTDLVSRLLMIEFAPLAKTIPERELREQFEADRSLMLGYLLDGLAAAMKHIDTTDITSKARLIDFLKVVTAAEVGLGWERGTFQKAFEMNQNNLTSDTLILNPVVRALQSFMAFSADTTWEGTMAELHDNLSNYAGNERRSESWPKTARYLSSELDRLKEDLPKVGIELEKLERTPSRRGLRIKRLPTFQIQDEDADAPKGQKVPLDPSIFDI